MARYALVGGLLVTALLAWGAGPSAVKPEAKLETTPAPSAAAVLAKRADFSGFDDPKTTLEEALAALTKLYGVTFEINEAAFRAAMINDVLQTPVAERPVPKMANARLSAVLRKVLGVVAQKTGAPATWLVRRDGIEVLPEGAVRAEVWGNYQGPFLPLVNADFEKRPLNEALQELASQAGMSVVIDVRVGDKAAAPVTARLLNTPLDTAVRLLADMAGLRPFQLDNMLYVTTPENAERLEKQEKPPEGTDEPDRGRRLGSGPSGIPAPGLAPGGM
jgi:hypothetical protein